MKIALLKFQRRWNAKDSILGNILKIFFGYVLGFCVACGSVLEYTHLVPEDWVPQEVKYGIAIAAFVGFIAGKMTKQDNGGKQDKV